MLGGSGSEHRSSQTGAWHKRLYISYSLPIMSKTKALFAGALAGLVAGVFMTTIMLVLALFGVATPLAIIGDRLSVFIPPGRFLNLMGSVGGYNHLKQLGVGSTLAGQLLVATLAGAVFGLFSRRTNGRASPAVAVTVLILLPLLVFVIALWPVLGTSYRGLPIGAARVVTLVGFALCLFVYERILITALRSLAQPAGDTAEFTPSIGRRALVLGGLGLLAAGGAAALMRRLYGLATFSYDGTQYKGSIVQGITPNDQFYCVTKNVIDPRVDADVWRLEVTGLVHNRRTYRIKEIKEFAAIEQQTTLMCISNGLDAGLISNAIWKGFPLRNLIEASSPVSRAGRVHFHGVDNYSDTIPWETAMDPTTLLAYEMNGVPLPHRHGYPLRAIVPGYFGEKHVKWLTRVEITGSDATGFYETQGWGPDFIAPTRSRIDLPYDQSLFSLAKQAGPIEVKGIAYGGDRGVSRVELSFDDGGTWSDAAIYYGGGDLAWSLWNTNWMPNGPGDYTLVVRATDGEGEVQEWEPDRSPFSGITGFHKITVYIR